MKNMHGIIFSYEKRNDLRELADIRTAASIPFGGRYRAVDFALYNGIGQTNSGHRNGFVAQDGKIRCWGERINNGCIVVNAVSEAFAAVEEAKRVAACGKRRCIRKLRCAADHSAVTGCFMPGSGFPGKYNTVLLAFHPDRFYRKVGIFPIIQQI